MVIVNLDKYLEKEERSLRWVASKTGIAVSTLQNIKQGKTQSISFDVLEKLCDLFKCDVADMIKIVKEN
ncbi:putative transcriptional regulator [Clostridium beijerinckii]|uniref:helix-turn-helix domain-containing protein n=1 Tax=Clostridium beijerinckii TaxID=1520 RepID=UPI00157045AE|nr:helix-turn-helix transcriptional regulator [Clostridium beijerinckii]NRT32621.1 putative transcriptional regulator [Clostridium beijerinckii]NRT47951.1 putative transcriptional regulator [Clostridium beijerinckii]NRZ23753.1 putative transcriptional regulator [Clostridium beijerinckii]